ncbi:hypothetical protein PR048_001130 [Dryococelus australis]|uniref:CCHC-type domain-containing protein n=1 Tax=Dryococelus australis TaxID=614101 RepID=A0ABQ9IH58_9NEOP|nr:hypothetical protein PR048_001130 [Dryococelus australis]
MASKVAVVGKELDLQAAFNHLASRLEGLKHEKLDLKRQVGSTPVNLKDRSDLSGTVPIHVRNFMLLPTIPLFSGKSEDNVRVRVFFIKIKQAANVCNWSEKSAVNIVEADKRPGKEQDTSVKSFGKSVFAVEHNGDKCFFCHKVGHKIKDCCNRAKACFGCGQLGHVVRVSPEKSKQNKVSDAHVDKNDNCEQSFIALKKALTISPVLAYPDFNKPSILATNSSQFAIGSVLSQVVTGE